MTAARRFKCADQVPVYEEDGTTLGTRVSRFEAFTPAGQSLGLYNRFRAAADALYHDHCRSYDGAT
jgi:hypothetical protein